MNVELIDSMGGDLSVVNAARVSFGKMKKKLDKKDERLIAYLAKHKHWTPFGHCTLQFHIKAPVFVARQLVKHQVGLVWNEISRRYVDSEPEYYEPEKLRICLHFAILSFSLHLHFQIFKSYISYNIFSSIKYIIL